MSDDNETTTREATFLESIGDELGFDISRIREELAGGGPEAGTDRVEKGPVRHPTEEEIVDKATSTLIDHKQRDKANQKGDVEDHRTMEVEIDIEDPNVVVHQFATALYEEHEDLLAYLHENSLFDAGGPSLEADDSELITYIIDEREESPNPALFIGGATPLRVNMANRAELTEDETRLVKLAHTIAARQSGYDRHLLLDEVIIVPLEDPGENPYQ